MSTQEGQAPPDQKTTFVGVVIPTHDRPEGLSRTLQALGPTPDGWHVDVVVVENGSFKAKDLALAYGATYVHLDEGNASAARNAGAARVAWMQVLVFVDDDAVPLPGWLEGLSQPILSGQADATVGGITVDFDLPVSSKTRAEFVDTDLSMDPSAPFLVGMNMAIRPSAFFDLAGFETLLGPGALGGGEDVLLGLRLVKAGGQLLYVPDARVRHVVPAQRLTTAALRRRAAGAGRGDGWIVHHWLDSVPSFLILRTARSLVIVGAARLLHIDEDRERGYLQRFWRERQLLIERRKPARYSYMDGGQYSPRWAAFGLWWRPRRW